MGTFLHIVFVILAGIGVMFLIIPFGVSLSLLMLFIGTLALGEHVYNNALPIEMSES